MSAETTIAASTPLRLRKPVTAGGELVCVATGLHHDDTTKIMQWWEHADIANGNNWPNIVAACDAVFPTTQTWSAGVAWNRSSGIRLASQGSVHVHIGNKNIGKPSETWQELYVAWEQSDTHAELVATVPHPHVSMQVSKPRTEENNATDVSSEIGQFQSGWDDLFTYGISTGALWRTAGSGSAPEISEASGRIGWILLAPIRATADWWDTLPAHKRSVTMVGIIAAGTFWFLLFAQALPSDIKRQGSLKLGLVSEEERRKIIERQTAAEEALAYANRERASALLQQSATLLKDIPESDTLQQTQSRLEHALSNVETRIDEQNVLQNTGDVIGAAVFGNRLLWIGTDDSIRWYDIPKKQQIANIPAGGTVQTLRCIGADCFLLTSNRLLRLDTNEKRTGQWSKEWQLPAQWPKQVVDVFPYRQSLYLLTQNGDKWQIFKASFGTKIGKPVAWNPPQPGIARHLKVNISITLDVWPAGGIGPGYSENWLSGKQKSKKPLNLAGPLGIGAMEIGRGAQGAIWFDPTNTRIVQEKGQNPLVQAVKQDWNIYKIAAAYGKRILLIGKQVVSVSWPGYDGIK